MKPELILQADILDLIFDGRNKDYGAYDLRKGYDRRMNLAMAGVSTFVILLLLMSFVNRPSLRSTARGRIVEIDTLVISPPPETKPKPPVEPPPSNPATIKHTSLLLTNEPVADTLPPVDQLDQNVQIGLQNKAGDSILSDVPPPSNHGAGRSVQPVVSEPPLEESAISITAEIMPEFPGGQAAFTRFLSKNLRVPENSMDPGQQIRIVVRFVVGKEGEISDFVFLQTNGEVFEEEVLRVMKKMPKWKPGSQNGKKVRVYFNLPVIFQAPEE